MYLNISLSFSRDEELREKSSIFELELNTNNWYIMISK